MTDDTKALAGRAEVRGFAAGVEAAARVAREGCLVPPDGGSPTEAERLLCEEIERRIRSLAAIGGGDE